MIPGAPRGSIRHALSRAAAALKAAGVSPPRAEAEWLLGSVLGLSRAGLTVEGGRVLHRDEQAEFDELIARRRRREPLQHILGTAEFYGLEFAVNRDVLIPRPETELLAERACDWLGSLPEPGQLALDFGTGSGCLAVTLASRCPQSRVWAIDISEAALVVARANAARHGVLDRIQFGCGDGLAALPGGLRFGLVVSNPPYIPTADLEGLQPEVRDFDPRAALDGGADGLDFYRRLAAELPPVLAPLHRVIVELGDGQAPGVEALWREQNWIVERVEADYCGVTRYLTASRRGEGGFEVDPGLRAAPNAGLE